MQPPSNNVAAKPGNPPEPKAKIFISYSRKDSAFADRLEGALEAHGFAPLIDRDDIYAFEDWWRRIEALITEADTVVFVLSPDSVRAGSVCHKEVQFAALLKKRFAPVVYRQVDDSAVPPELARLNFIFFADDAHFDESFGRLVDALETDIGWLRQHTAFANSARAWLAAKQPSGLLLRSPLLEEAERWIASRPHGAPAPAEETVAFVADSRRAASRRRNILSGSLAIGLAAALVLAGLAYWQRGLAVQNSGDAKVELARALMVSGSPVRALAAALDGARTIQSVRGPTSQAEALLYELLWTRDLPIATVRLDARYFGSDAFSPRNLVARSMPLADKTAADVFCVTGVSPGDGQNQKTAELCLRWADGELNKVASAGLTGEAEFEDSKSAEALPGSDDRKINVRIGTDVHTIAFDGPGKDARAYVCLNRFAIVQYTPPNAVDDEQVTILYDASKKSKVLIKGAPDAGFNEPSCHRSQAYIYMAGRGGPIAFVSTADGKLVPFADIGTLTTFRHGFESAEAMFSLDLNKQVALFSGMDVAGEAGGSKLIYQPALLSLKNGRRIATFEGHETLLRGAVLSRSGKLAATLGNDGQLRLWDVGRIEAEPRYTSLADVDYRCRYEARQGIPAGTDGERYCNISDDGQNDSYVVLAQQNKSERLVVAKKAAAGSDLALVDSRGKVTSRLFVPVNLNGDNSRNWTVNGGSHVLSLDGAGRLALVSLVRLGEITGTYEHPVKWISRFPAGSDTFLIAQDDDLLEVSVDPGSQPPFVSKRKIPGAGLDAFVALVHSAAPDLDTDADGTFYRRGSALVYCATPGGWIYRPQCALVDEKTLAPVDGHLCLVGNVTDVALFCLSAGRDALEAYVFASKKWLTVAKDSFVLPGLKESGGKLSISVDSFSQCPDRVVLSYSEYYNGGGGLQSPGKLVFDLATGQAMTVLHEDRFVPNPGFCDFQALVDHASTIATANAGG